MIPIESWLSCGRFYQNCGGHKKRKRQNSQPSIYIYIQQAVPQWKHPFPKRSVTVTWEILYAAEECRVKLDLKMSNNKACIPQPGVRSCVGSIRGKPSSELNVRLMNVVAPPITRVTVGACCFFARAFLKGCWKEQLLEHFLWRLMLTDNALDTAENHWHLSWWLWLCGTQRSHFYVNTNWHIVLNSIRLIF